MKDAKRKEKQSVAERLDKMSHMLEDMRRFFQKYVPSEDDDQQPSTSAAHKDKPYKASKKGELTEDNSNQTLPASNSDTTIYQGVLSKLNDSNVNEDNRIVIVDPKISFKKNAKVTEVNKNDSTSSDDRIDTSDELLEIDSEISERFIADYAAEAKRKKVYSDDQEDDEKDEQESA